MDEEKNTAIVNNVISYVEHHVLKRRNSQGARSKKSQNYEEFVAKVLQDTSNGHFTYRHANKTTEQYFCERHSKPRQLVRKKTTRSNSCNAYISFQSVKHSGDTVVVVRRKLDHNHDIADQSNSGVNAIDPELQSYIEHLLLQGKRNVEVTVLAFQWAQSHGHTDVRNRRFFVTPKDISRIMDGIRAKQRIHKNDSVSVEILCTDKLKDSILFYQPLRSDQPLIIVYQNRLQRDMMSRFSQNLVFMDASFKGLTAYGFAVYCLLVKSERGSGTPMAFFITSADTTDTLVTCLEVLKKTGDFKPRAFMVDKDMKEVAAIKNVFPESSVLLCWFHVLQAVYRWMNQKDSGVSGQSNAEVRKKMIKFLRRLKYAGTREDFNVLSEAFREFLATYPKVLHYIDKEWLPIASMWANFGRKFFHEDQETNNLVERFFLFIKLNWLGGYGIRRVDELLLLLHGDLSKYHEYMEQLHKVGRLPAPTSHLKGQEQAAQLLLSGWAERTVWVDDHSCVCQVPAQFDPSKSHMVDLTRATCTCSTSSQGGMCKHMHVGLAVAANRGVSVEGARQLIAEELFEQGSFNLDNAEVIVMDGENISSVTGDRCSCIASSHGLYCLCKQVAKLVMEGAGMSVANDSVQNDIPHSIVHEDVQEVDRVVIAQQKLNEIAAYLSNVQGHAPQDMVFVEINKLHSMVFNMKYRKMTRKRKIGPNSVSRKIIDKALKRKRMANDDHRYSGTKQKRKHIGKPDGSFHRRRSSRKASFQ